jgi:hypothetical protein
MARYRETRCGKGERLLNAIEKGVLPYHEVGAYLFCSTLDETPACLLIPTPALETQKLIDR